ncbi:MAG: hypothetical protein J6B50_06470 [Lachnospiraceae bacterium]|nr:hypothetical protein [Lachnospiraceae bacterium]
MDNNYNQAYYTEPVSCPGKEITSMVFGINALVWGVFGLLFCWHIVLAIAYGVVGIGCAIPSLVLFSQVKKIATVITKKGEIGKKLAIAGLICSIVAIVLSIILLFVFIALGVGTAMIGEY